MFFCINYINKYQFYFSNPKSWVLWALINLHDYLSFFLLNVLLIVVVFMIRTLLGNTNTILHINQNKKNFIFNYVLFRVKIFSHAPLLEFFWTAIPLAMLGFMAVPSYRILYSIEQLIDPLHTISILGNQWYRTYTYSDFDVVSEIILQLDSEEEMKKFKKKYIKKLNLFMVTFDEMINKFDNKYFLQQVSKVFRTYEESKLMYDAVIISEEDLPLSYPRLLCTDQVLVLPSTACIRLLLTSNDVIHSWALPSHGIKMDAVPGRINQVNFLTSFWGTYWGQCSESCGINHGFMPIEVRVININDYFDYLKINISYKYDKFLPLLENLTMNYLESLNFSILDEKLIKLLIK